MSVIKPGQLCFWLDNRGLPASGVVTRANVKEYQTLWQLLRLKPGSWQLRLWHKQKGIRPVPASGDNAVSFKARNRMEAEQRGREYIELCRRTWREAQEQGNVFKGVPPSEQERWIDAWTHAHKSEWPNLFKVPKGKPVHDALAADLIAKGYSEEATIQIAKLAAKTTLTPADKLNVWLVTNWLHGKRLIDKNPEERLALLKESEPGRKNSTMPMLKMRLTRLALTHRRAN